MWQCVCSADAIRLRQSGSGGETDSMHHALHLLRIKHCPWLRITLQCMQWMLLDSWYVHIHTGSNYITNAGLFSINLSLCNRCVIYKYWLEKVNSETGDAVQMASLSAESMEARAGLASIADVKLMAGRPPSVQQKTTIRCAMSVGIHKDAVSCVARIIWLFPSKFLYCWVA